MDNDVFKMDVKIGTIVNNFFFLEATWEVDLGTRFTVRMEDDFMDFLVISQVEFRQLIRNFTRNVGIKRRMSYCQGNFVVKEMTKTVT